MRVFRVAALLALLALPAVMLRPVAPAHAAGGAGAVLLRYHFAVGQTTGYKASVTIKEVVTAGPRPVTRRRLSARRTPRALSGPPGPGHQALQVAEPAPRAQPLLPHFLHRVVGVGVGLRPDIKPGARAIHLTLGHA